MLVDFSFWKTEFIIFFNQRKRNKRFIHSCCSKLLNQWLQSVMIATYTVIIFQYCHEMFFKCKKANVSCFGYSCFKMPCMRKTMKVAHLSCWQEERRYRYRYVQFTCCRKNIHRSVLWNNTKILECVSIYTGAPTADFSHRCAWHSPLYFISNYFLVDKNLCFEM